MKSLALTIILIFGLTSIVSAETVGLAWNANTESDLSGYRVYVGTESRAYRMPIDVGNTTAYEVLDLEAGITYFFAVTAYDTSGNESGFSNEVTETVEDTSPDTTPPAPPTGLVAVQKMVKAIILLGESILELVGISNMNTINLEIE